MKIYRVKVVFPSGKSPAPYTFRSFLELTSFVNDWKARGGTIGEVLDDLGKPVTIDCYKTEKHSVSNAKAKTLRPVPTGGRNSPVQTVRGRGRGRKPSNPHYGSYCR